MEKITIDIDTPYIQVDSLLKLANIVSSGGEAHYLSESGQIKLNNIVVMEKRKKIYVNDTVTISNNCQITVKGKICN